jgi:hypothetical protein
VCGPVKSPPEAGSNRHLRPEFSPPLAAGTEPLGEARPPLTDEQYLAKLDLFNHYIVIIPFFFKCGGGL